ncbi:Uncharacterised protein [Mycobacterium tuberculosis]|uniref:Uncharacterized protein n=1 Tax=Mycobacterium tuberculosis TaxID=1773 RepID=A0A0U0T7B9_MYCTX|nr:Uncharacterised protein [Mycobacterium tuberculosis]
MDAIPPRSDAADASTGGAVTTKDMALTSWGRQSTRRPVAKRTLLQWTAQTGPLRLRKRSPSRNRAVLTYRLVGSVADPKGGIAWP